MKLIRYQMDDDVASVGVLREDIDAAYDLIRAIDIYATAHGEYAPLLTDMLDLLDVGLVDAKVLLEVDTYVEEHSLLEDLTVTGYKLLPPLSRPRAVYALGRNYPAHAKEQGADVPEEPIVFAKAPTSVIGPEDDVIYKSWFTRVDPEAELAVIIGRQGSDISEEEAPAHIAGYTILNDVTERDLQSKDIGNSHPWFRSKGIDTFCPMGPSITLTDEIKQPVELDVELKVNGEIRQKDNTRSMTFSIPFLISWISRYNTLHPGDVISSGTPEGIEPVKPGDVMEVHVEGIGVLRNRVVGE